MNFPRLITFTKARDKTDFWENGEYSKKKTSRLNQVSSTGQEARSFYESLLATEGQQSVSTKPSRKRRIQSSTIHEESTGENSQREPNTSAREPSKQRTDQQRLRCSQNEDRIQSSSLHEESNGENAQHEPNTFAEELTSQRIGHQLQRCSQSEDRIQNSSSREESNRENAQHEPNTSSQEPTSQKIGHQLLRCSQNGDLKGLRNLVEKERCNVNFRDGYYWTALMCAAFAGRKEIVSYLIKRGAAWIGVCETRGKDALMLAKEAGHRDVVKLLEDSLKGQPQESQPRSMPVERKYCDICKTHYQEDSRDIHERSTVHLFNKKKKIPATYYAIPDHNVGFKMMLKEGWDRESGLGPDGAGRKFPVKTILKRDQKGLGFQTEEKPKVTHFPANDPSAVDRPQIKQARIERVATLSKREERRKEAKAKAWERNLRTYMNVDL
ncbi:G patch domain and ankyrin repeat-containing protein 1 [Hyperolius riggenbachi]|uniref:G patch domain and ankyrin repeat-containing protein 1 n=1 Tax=Hyperolius riggenbachi TaxID=752182 RepID=UPI0035A3D571